MPNSSNSSISKKPEKKMRKFIEELDLARIEETKEIFEKIDEEPSKTSETIKISQKQEQNEQRDLISYHKSKEESESLLKAISAKITIKDYNIFSDFNKKSQKFANLDQNYQKKKLTQESKKSLIRRKVTVKRNQKKMLKRMKVLMNKCPQFKKRKNL